MEATLDILWTGFLIVLCLGGIFTQLLGLITVVQWVKTPNEPNDESNRINNITSWWIGLTRPEVMGKAWFAFQQDVMDNIDDVEWANTPLPPLPKTRPLYERVDDEVKKTKKKKKS